MKGRSCGRLVDEGVASPGRWDLDWSLLDADSGAVRDGWAGSSSRCSGTRRMRFPSVAGDAIAEGHW